MRIAFVTNAPLCSGAEEHLIELSQWLTGKGVEVAFLVRRGGMLEKRLNGKGLSLYPIDRDGPKKIFSINQTASAIHNFSPHAVSINREHDVIPTYAALKIIQPFLRNKPSLVSVFHTPTGRKVPLLTRMDGIIFTSSYTRDAFLPSNPGIEGLAKVIHYGIDIFNVDEDEKLDPDRKRKFFRGKTFPVIGMVGELWKNQVELVDVTAGLANSYPSITTAIIGGGSREQIEEIKNRASILGVSENIILTGRVERSVIPQIFHDLDLSVSTHRNEGFGIVHIESLTAMTPVVAYRSGGYVEMLSRGGGILVDGGTKELTGEIERLLRDAPYRESMAREGRAIVEENYTRDVMGRNHLSYYEKISAKNE